VIFFLEFSFIGHFFTRSIYLAGIYSVVLMTLEKTTQFTLAITCVASLIFFVIASTGNYAFAGNSGEYQKDHINWKKFQNSNEYKDASNKEQKCLDKANRLGNNLAGYEVRDCLN
jgi:hypothetical protein